MGHLIIIASIPERASNLKLHHHMTYASIDTKNHADCTSHLSAVFLALCSGHALKTQHMKFKDQPDQNSKSLYGMLLLFLASHRFHFTQPTAKNKLLKSIARTDMMSSTPR